MKKLVIILSIVFFGTNANAQCIDSTLIDMYAPCTFIYAPVCGCDNNTYSNDCVAENYFGITQYTQGPCTAVPCVDPSLIDPYAICPAIYMPVCGCNNITYSNDCEAVNLGGVTSWTQGPCTGVPCVDPSQIDLNLDCFNANVESDEPVCGCDGNTYVNACVAESKFGITQFNPGPCDLTDCISNIQANGNLNCANYPIQYPVCGCDGNTYNSPCEAAQAGILEFEAGACTLPCIDTDLIDNFVDCGFNAEVVCGCDSTNYFNSCSAQNYFGIIDYSNGPCDANECIIPSQISPSVNCVSSPAQPVCGCDGVNYPNECAAFYGAGLSSWTFGPCVNTIEKLRQYFQINVNPNPTSDFTYVSLTNELQKDLVIKLSTLTGKTLRILHNGNEVKVLLSLDLSELDSGLYFLTVTAGETNITEKLIVR